MIVSFHTKFVTQHSQTLTLLGLHNTKINFRNKINSQSSLQNVQQKEAKTKIQKRVKIVHPAHHRTSSVLEFSKNVSEEQKTQKRTKEKAKLSGLLKEKKAELVFDKKKIECNRSKVWKRFGYMGFISLRIVQICGISLIDIIPNGQFCNYW